MRRALAPYAQARSEYDIFADLAAALGVGERFTEGRDEMTWLRHLYEGWRARVGQGPSPFDEFWASGLVEAPGLERDRVLFDAFRADPERAPLGTPSGRIEIFSAAIETFGYDDCPGHPTWLPPTEWLGSPLAARYPLHLIANNPTTRLHSQLDVEASTPVTPPSAGFVDRTPPSHPSLRPTPDNNRAIAEPPLRGYDQSIRQIGPMK